MQRRAPPLPLVLAALALLLGGAALAPVAAAAAHPRAVTLRAERPPSAVRPLARPAIVGGTPLAISQVPWQIFLQADVGGGNAYNCGGSILDATTVVTAAHCVFDSATAQRFPVERLTVFAGTGSVRPLEATTQIVGVASLRVHPGYVAGTGASSVAPDDVAVLKLAGAIAFGATAAPIGLVAPGATPAGGSAATISGFGRQAAGGVPDGRLYGVTTAIGDQLGCGGDANALVLCIASPTGSACEGDSGGPLTSGAVLAGVASFVTLNGPTGECGVGSVNGYTNLAAPEIQQFVLGSDAPPLAPRGGRDVSARGVLQAGQSIACSAGTWSNAPTFAYAFVDTRDGGVLQAGPSATYGFSAADVGRTVSCQVNASTAGGTAIARTTASAAIAAAPVAPNVNPPPGRRAAKPALRLAVGPTGRRVKPGKRFAVAIRVANRGRAAAHGVVVCDRPGRGLALIELPRTLRRVRGGACRRIGSLRAGTERVVRLTLRVGSGARPGLLRNPVTLSSSDAGRTTVTLRVRVPG